MKIFVNGQPQELAQTQLDRALIELGFTGTALATALNGSFVAANSRSQTTLNENDRLEVLAPMQGG